MRKRQKRECLRNRCQVGLSTASHRDPCHDGICSFPRSQPGFRILLRSPSTDTPLLMDFLLWDPIWCSLTVSCPGFQSIIKDLCVCPLPTAQNKLSVAVVNGKGHLSWRPCWLTTKTKERSQQGTDKSQRQFLEKGISFAY